MIPRPKNLSGFLEGLLKNNDFSDSVRLKVFQNRWEEFVGRGMRVHSCPVKYEKGRLIVVVENTVWRQDLIFYNRKIIDLINRSGLSLRDIYYILGKPPSLGETDILNEEAEPLSPQEEKRLEEFRSKTLTEIHDEKLKNRLLRIREKQMQCFKIR